MLEDFREKFEDKDTRGKELKQITSKGDYLKSYLTEIYKIRDGTNPD
jgi:hypothetical protein